MEKVRPQEVPAPLGVLVRAVGPDMAAPDHDRATGLEGGGHPERLGVVQDHHIPWPDHRGELGLVAPDDLAIVLVLGISQRPAVAGRAVQMVVEPLGDAEEALVALDRHPSSVDTRAARVAEEHPQHLRDPTPGRRGVNVHHAAIAQPVAERIRGIPEKVLEALGPDKLGQVVGIGGGDVDLAHGDPLPGAAQGTRLPGRGCLGVAERVQKSHG